MLRLPVDFYPKLPFELVDPKAPDSSCADCKLGADRPRSGLDRHVKEYCISATKMRASDPDAKRGRLLLIGDPPGAKELDKGEHLVGVAGMLARQIARKHWPGEVVVSSALRCALRGKDATELMHRACRAYLAHEIASNGVERVICMGSQATKAVLGRGVDPVSARQGVFFTSTKIPVHITINPAATHHNRFLRRWFEEDLAWACTVDSRQFRPPDDAEALVVEDAVDAEIAVRELMKAEAPAFDFETFGSMGDVDFRALTCGVSPEPGMAYVWDEGYLGALRGNPAAKALRRWLASAAPKCGQNVPYDIRSGMRGLGVTPRGVVMDTRLARKMLQADADASLEDMALLVGVSSPKDEVEAYEKPVRRSFAKAVNCLQAGGLEGAVAAQRVLDDEEIEAGEMSREDLAVAVHRIHQRPGIDRYAGAFLKAALPRELRARYCASDAMVTAMLRRHLEPKIRADAGLAKVHDDVVVPLIHAISLMQDEGLPIDRTAIALLDKAMQAEIDQALAAVATHGQVNLNAPKDVGDFLFKRLGIPMPDVKLGKKRPKTSQPSVAKAVLERVNHPAAKAILRYRSAAKFKSTYAEGMLQYVRDDGKVHTDYLLDGTGTGRPSTHNPNVLNIPRTTTGQGKMCRDVFVAPEGWTIVELDQNQGEIRGAAMVSEDKVMLETLLAGNDFHLASAKLIASVFGIDPDVVGKSHPLRASAKNGNFAVIYGKSDENLAVQLGISVAEAANVRAVLLGKFQALKEYCANQLRLAKVSGEIRVPWAGGNGRRRPLWRIGDIDGPEKGTAERSSWNTPIQGLCAEFTNASIGALQAWIEEECFPAKLVLTVYDSIIALVRDGCIHEYVRNAQRICTQWHSYGVPLKWDVKFGKAWGSLQDYVKAA